MNIDQLRYLAEVARCGSISKAAENLYLSQPSVSEAVSKLEKELGEPLFRRGKGGVSLTSYGTEILPYIQNILDLVEQMPQSAIGQNKNKRPVFSVSNGGYRAFSEAVSLLYKAHAEEGIHINLFDQAREEALQTVASGDAELGGYGIWNFENDMIMTRLERHSLDFRLLGNSPVSVSVGPYNPLFKREEDWVTLDMIQGYPLLYSSAEHIMHLYKRLGLYDRKNLLVCRGRAGRGELLNWTDALSLSGSYFANYEKAKYYSNRRVFRLAGVDYYASKGYLVRRGIPLSSLAQEFVGILKDINSPKN